jgi:hypothetical protein
MAGGFEHVLRRRPFAVRELHPDNGPEFLNAHLVRFWGAQLPGLRLSRSRPYHKNDNRFVEQKNGSLVRAYFGNARLDTPAQCAALNALYERMWLYYNVFQPVLHLVEKITVGTRLRQRWDTAQTPYERLAATTALSAAQQAALDTLYQTTNPRALRREIHARIEAILLPGPLLTTEPAVGAA